MVVAVLVVLSAALLGLVVGSFLTAIVWRLPRSERLFRSNRCRQCKNLISWRDSIPVFSWCALRGRCRYCAWPISVRYPVIEGTTALAFGFIAAVIGADASQLWVAPAFFYLAAISIALAVIDLDTQRLPNAIVMPSIVIGALLLTVASIGTANGEALLGASIGSVVLFTFYGVLSIISPRGMGMGDVKFAAVLGLYLGWLGWPVWVVGTFSAFMGAGIFAVFLLLGGQANHRTVFSFGPWMILGAWFGIVLGPQLVACYGEQSGVVAAGI